jgi:dienelactone hydrolase
MQLWRRVLYRARVLTQQWIQHNAFVLGMCFGGTLTLVLILVH